MHGCGSRPDGWIEWQGYECPVEEGTLVDVRFRSGLEEPALEAGRFNQGRESEMVAADWTVTGSKGDIIAYRPILDAGEPEPPAWENGLPPVGCECECTFAAEDHDTWHRGVVTLRGVAPEGHEIVAIKVDDIIAVYRSAKHIRPIRSEEDRITEEFERIMYKPAMTREMAARIYEAIRDGKVPGVKLTGGEV